VRMCDRSSQVVGQDLERRMVPGESLRAQFNSGGDQSEISNTVWRENQILIQIASIRFVLWDITAEETRGQFIVRSLAPFSTGSFIFWKAA
jgi:hypothetical protein